MELPIKNAIVCITSIQRATTAVKKFCALPVQKVIVAGDLSSPLDYELNHEKLDYLLQKQQNTEFPELSASLPWKSYTRKNIAFATAIKYNAELIIDTDDDNIPYEDFEILPFDSTYYVTDPEIGFINIYKAFTEQNIWPRGFPLPLLKNEDNFSDTLSQSKISVGIWQGLADGDPDVDAIYRLVVNSPCIFYRREPIVLNPGTWTPFNSQNTIFRKEVFPLLYIPHSVSFRYSDILRSWVAQPILWAAGYRLGFTRATVFQERNPHDYMKDFESEIPMYLSSIQACEIIKSAVNPQNSILGNMWSAYSSLCQAEIVKESELKSLSEWFKLFD